MDGGILVRPSSKEEIEIELVLAQILRSGNKQPEGIDGITKTGVGAQMAIEFASPGEAQAGLAALEKLTLLIPFRHWKYTRKFVNERDGFGIENELAASIVVAIATGIPSDQITTGGISEPTEVLRQIRQAMGIL